MTSRDFCFWLQGYFELEESVSNKPDAMVLTDKQIAKIRNHLNMVFKHEIDPGMGDAAHQELLNNLHGNGNNNVLLRC